MPTGTRPRPVKPKKGKPGVTGVIAKVAKVLIEIHSHCTSLRNDVYYCGSHYTREIA